MNVKITYDRQSISVPCSRVKSYSRTLRMYDIPEDSYQDMDALLPDSFSVLGKAVSVCKREGVQIEIEDDNTPENNQHLKPCLFQKV